MSTFFISDLHFSHENCAIKRGFKNSLKHDKLIIENWNKTIHNNDKVWVLEDCTMENPHFFHLMN